MVLLLKIIIFYLIGSPSKRQKLEKNVIQSETKTEICPHAEKCYRRNPHHFNLYDHPHCKYLAI